MAKDVKPEPAALLAFRMPLPSSGTRLVADEMMRQARAAEARGDRIKASKLRDRARLLHQGKGGTKR
ncbi:MAG: hypothetical protein ACRYG8_48885 [Janthinobacterium lividum]